MLRSTYHRLPFIFMFSSIINLFHVRIYYIQYVIITNLKTLYCTKRALCSKLLLTLQRASSVTLIKVTRSAKAWPQKLCPSLLGSVCPVPVRCLQSLDEYLLFETALMQFVSRSEISTFSKLRWVLYTAGWWTFFATCRVILWYWCCTATEPMPPHSSLQGLVRHPTWIPVQYDFFPCIRILFGRCILQMK